MSTLWSSDGDDGRGTRTTSSRALPRLHPGPDREDGSRQLGLPDDRGRIPVGQGTVQTARDRAVWRRAARGPYRGRGPVGDGLRGV